VKYIATTNCVVSYTADGERCTFVKEIKEESNCFKCFGFNCYSGYLGIILEGLTAADTSVCASAQFNIKGTSEHVFANGSNVVLEDDYEIKNDLIFINPTTQTEMKKTVTTKIINAGQNKVLAA